ncbi:FG-GAP repeat domain-containing protein [Celeribacter neptunius]|uniref:Repeat domain-containing protein n=1 Tax=Celeribacter neptunius TaxID=588602 RepID=A0A1I3J116_9RHOB|nr:VCBS repeat-containing protein [Celeribacter neptunius]SFI53870.1 Repeat domain-containing protein [Celeribacter neptunius]
MLKLAAIFAMVASPLAAGEGAARITGASYAEPTEVYGHGAVKGGENAKMVVALDDGSTREVSFKKSIFEDTAPRLHDFNGDGAPEIVTVVSGFATGSWVQVWSLDAEARLVPAKASAPIGQRHRWLAIAGIADFDGDGVDEIAYVDRPHLAKELVLMPVELAREGMLVASARAQGLTNHHLGAEEIEGGVRDCPGELPVILTADAEWQNIVETRYEGGDLHATVVAPYAGADSFSAYLRCE